ncbi:hypothetical protein B5X24_HaOG210275 [Helicoverpa armigera]|nr:hypothetical protein B5X24_HaOG210275 [Helicoverpa armigera]
MQSTFKKINKLFRVMTSVIAVNIKNGSAGTGSRRGGVVCAARLRSFAFCPPFDSRAAQPPPLFATRISLTWELLTSSCFTRGVIHLHRRWGPHVMPLRVREYFKCELCVIARR